VKDDLKFWTGLYNLFDSCGISTDTFNSIHAEAVIFNTLVNYSDRIQTLLEQCIIIVAAENHTVCALSYLIIVKI